MSGTITRRSPVMNVAYEVTALAFVAVSVACSSSDSLSDSERLIAGSEAESDGGANLLAIPAASPHTRVAYPLEAEFTAKWTRADALRINELSNQSTPPRGNSLPARLTMPTVPEDFPDTHSEVWVWDTWPLADLNAQQISYKGWEIAFSLTARRDGGYTFDDRHVHARIGLFFRKAGVTDDQRPENGGWVYGGNVLPEGVTRAVFGAQTVTETGEWSGSARIYESNRVDLFYTAVAFNRGTNAEGEVIDLTPADARIMRSEGRIFSDAQGVWITGFEVQDELLRPDGKWYQSAEQNNFYNFRDPYVFLDPQYPGRTFMVFEGNTAVERGAKSCTSEDLGYLPGDLAAETLQSVNDSEAVLHQGNIGLAEADNAELTQWHFLPPLLSANCVNDQTERPQVYFANGNYYLFTITHRSTYATGVDGPDGLYGFVGEGLRSDFEPMNGGSGLVLGNPTNLSAPHGTSANILPDENPNAYQAYSHYVMPGGLLQSFIDAVGPRRGGSYAPTVKLDIVDASTAADTTYGSDGIGPYGTMPVNRAADVPMTPDPRPLAQAAR